MSELRLALRALRRAPGFTLVAVVTLALGIGANTAIFSVVHAVLLRPLPYPDAASLVRVELQPRRGALTAGEASYTQWSDLRRESRLLEDVAGYATSSGGMLVELDGALESLRGHIVTGNLPRVLGVQPLLGRTWDERDDRPGAAPTLLISEALWRGRFGADASVLGRRIRVDGAPHQVIGVLPAGTAFPPGADVWRPLAASLPQELLDSAAAYINMVGRLAPGVTATAGRAEIDGIVDRTVNAALPQGMGLHSELGSFRDALFGEARGALVLLLLGAGLVLLVACANVANLQLVRGVGRQRELAVRRALGALPRHLARLSVTESLLLGVGGAAAGLVVAQLALRVIAVANPIVLFRADTVGVDHAALGISLCVALATVLAFGLLPVGQALNLRLAGALHGSGRSTTLARSGVRLMDAFVVSQVALALVLSVGAGLVLRSLDRLHRVDPGFDEAGVLTLGVPLLSKRYQQPEVARAFYDDLIERTEALPGVVGAAAVLLRPLDSPQGFDAPVTVEGQSTDEQTTNPILNYEAVTPRYFETMGVPLLAGRDFDARDAPDAPQVAILGATTAQRLWPQGDAVGRRLKLGMPESPAPWIEVVGVAGDVRSRALESGRLEIYVPYTQTPWTPQHLVVRASGAEPGALVPALRRVMREIDPDVQPVEAFTTAALVGRALARPRFQSLLFGVFAFLGLAIGAVGLYGVMAYSLALRTREMGIRTALGASRRALLALALGHGLKLAGFGVGVGLLVAVSGSGLLRDLLFEVSPQDPGTLLAVAGAFLCVAALASLLPAWRASRADPTIALRSE